MRGEARRRTGAEKHPAGTRAAKTVAENAGLLPAGARGARHGGVGAERPGDAGAKAALQSGLQQERTCSGWAISPSIPAIPPAPPLDLTLVDLNADNSARFDPAKAYADCTAPAGARAPEASVDMGTGYDCSDVKAHTAARSITPAQRRWRNLLVAAMAKQGFVNYSKEWWHFSLPGAAGPRMISRSQRAATESVRVKSGQFRRKLDPEISDRQERP